LFHADGQTERYSRTDIRKVTVALLRYKSEDRGFDSPWYLWDFSLTYSHNPSGRTMALGLTEPLTEMSTRNISWG
jgi:hypothetical protein